MSAPRARLVRRASIALLVVIVALSALFVSRLCPDIPAGELRARWATGASRFVDVDGRAVHVRDEGAGPTLVLLHGTASSLHTWDGWASSLTRRYRVVRFDLPAFGLTGPRPDRDYSIEAYVRFVEQVVDRLALGPFVLGGNSLGGRIAWHYALAHPDRLRGLVLVDAGGYPTRQGGRPLAFRFAGLPLLPELLSRLDPRALVADGVRKAYGDPSRIRPEVLERYRELALFPGSRAAFIDRIRADATDDTTRIAAIRTPTLVLWGERDHLIDPANAGRFEHDLPSCRVVRYADLGHVPMEEDPARTVRDVEAFLASLP